MNTPNEELYALRSTLHALHSTDKLTLYGLGDDPLVVFSNGIETFSPMVIVLLVNFSDLMDIYTGGRCGWRGVDSLNSAFLSSTLWFRTKN